MTQSSGARPAQDRRSIRSIIIHRPMQREFTIITIAILMLSMVFVNFLIKHTLEEIIAQNVTGFGRVGAYNVLSDASFELIVRVTLVMFVTIITVGLFGVFFLHRVAGPVYRFHQLFRRLGHNEIPQDVALRSKDFFKESANELNEVFRALRKRKDAIQRAEGILSTLSHADLRPEAKAKLDEIRSILRDSVSSVSS